MGPRDALHLRSARADHARFGRGSIFLIWICPQGIEVAQ